MLTKEQAEALARPFEPNEIEWRVGQAGLSERGPWIRALAYLTSRAVMERLDEVFGVGGWSHTIREIALGDAVGVICTLNVGGGCIHEDVAECSDIEALKGAASGALKRAAVGIGIGRYLYYLDDGFAKVHPNGKFRYSGKSRDGKPIDCKWDPPALPAWALPAPGAKRYNAYSEPTAVPQDDRKPLTAPPPPPPPSTLLMLPEGVAVPDGIPEDFVASLVDLIERPNADALLTGTLGNASKKIRTLGMTPVVAKSKNPIDLVNAILESKAMILDAEQGRAAT